jgi:hypothetical protein
MLEADPVLGSYIANYPSDRLRLLVPAGLVILSVGVLLNYTVAEMQPFGPALTVVLTAAVSLATGWRTLHFWNREVILYESGFTYREGGRTVYFIYEEIAAIRQQGEQLAYFGGLIRRAVYRFTLVTIRGETLMLTNLYHHVDRLIAHVERQVYPRLEVAIQKRLAAGEAVPFSANLRLSAAGLLADVGELAWATYGGVQVANGHLTILNREAEWLALPLSQIDNIPVLLNLLRTHKS